MNMRNHNRAPCITIVTQVLRIVLACGCIGYSMMPGHVYSNTTEGETTMIAVYAVDGWYNDLDKSTAEIVDFLEDHSVNAVFGGYEDKEFREECKRRGIMVYAKVMCFQGKKYWESHPESRPIGVDGEPLPQEEWYCGVCPNQEWRQQQILDTVRRLVNEYKVDGVWLDFIRYPCHWEGENPNLYQSCFCDRCTDLFMEDTSTTVPASIRQDTQQLAEFILEKHHSQWVAWKCRCIADFVEKVADMVEQKNPDTTLGLFGVPWQSDEYNDAIRRIVGQDFRLLATNGVDVFSPMVYHKLCYRDAEWINEITAYFSSITKKRTVPIIQACSIPDTLDNEEFTRAFYAALEPPSSGVILFHAAYLEKEHKWTSLKKAAHSPQNPYTNE